MSLLTSHIATKGFLAGATLAVAASGFLQPDVAAPEVPKFGGGGKFIERRVDIRKPQIIHALDFEVSSNTELTYKVHSKYEFETKVPVGVTHEGVTSLLYNVSADTQGKNVRVTDVTSTAKLAIGITSTIETVRALPADTKHKSKGTFAFNIMSDILVDTAAQSTSMHSSNTTLTIGMTSSIESRMVTPAQDNEIEEVLAVAIRYLYG